MGQERRTSNTIKAFPFGIFTKKPFHGANENKGTLGAVLCPLLVHQLLVNSLRALEMPVID